MKKKRPFSVKNRIKKGIAATCMIGGLAFFVYPLATSFLRSVWAWSHAMVCRTLSYESASFELENVYAQNLKQEIIAFLTQQTTNVNLLSFSPDDFYIGIKKKFDIVSKVLWKRVAPKVLHLKVIGVRPQYKVNERFVVGENRKLYDQDLFKDYALNSLKQLTMAQDLCGEKISEQVHQFLGVIPNARWDAFDITYQASSNIVLRPKNRLHNMLIITDEKSFFDDEKIMSVGTIYHDLLAKEKLSEKKIKSGKCTVVFDTRFKSRVLVKVFVAAQRGRGG